MNQPTADDADLNETPDLAWTPSRVARGDDFQHRLQDYGAPALNDLELLTAVLGVPTQGPCSQALAKAFGAMGENLRAFLLRSPRALALVPGVGTQRATRLACAVELGRRLSRQPASSRPVLKTPRDVVAFLQPRLANLYKEEFHVLCLNARSALVEDVRIAQGTVDSCPVDPREVFAAALELRACNIVLAHNHPSGDPQPSSADVALTEQIIQGACHLGIRVVDHIIVGHEEWTSFALMGHMPLMQPS